MSAATIENVVLRCPWCSHTVGEIFIQGMVKTAMLWCNNRSCRRVVNAVLG
jgi:hypothetical protein